MGCNPPNGATTSGVQLRLDGRWTRHADQRRRPNTVPAGAEKALRLHKEEHAAETFTPRACSSWMNSPMVRVECPMVHTVSGHFVPVSFRDGCACCHSETVLPTLCARLKKGGPWDLCLGRTAQNVPNASGQSFRPRWRRRKSIRFQQSYLEAAETDSPIASASAFTLPAILISFLLVSPSSSSVS